MSILNAGLESATDPVQSDEVDNFPEAFWLPRCRNTYTVAEYEALSIPLVELFVDGQLDLYDEIVASKYLNAFLQGNRVVLSAGHFVGYIPLNDHVALNVVPRVPVGNLTRILRIADETPLPLERFVRAYVADHQPLPSVFDDLAASFIAAVTEVAHYGLYHSYRERKTDTSFPRGRIIVGETLRRHHARGVRFRVTASWHERTADNALNRLLKYTIWLLDRRYAAQPNRKGVARLRTLLTRLYRIFNQVPLDPARTFLSDAFVTDPELIPFHRSYYLQAVYLALLLVEDRGIDLSKHGGKIRIPSLLIDLEQAFEEYLRNVLRGEMGTKWSIQVLDGNRADQQGARKGLFDQAASQDATPDIVLRTATPGSPLIIEVKYKKIVGTPDRQDLNQVITYGTSYRSDTVVLAHPRANDQPGGLRFIGSIDKLNVYQYSFDLAADLEREETLFARELARLLHLERD